MMFLRRAMVIGDRARRKKVLNRRLAQISAGFDFGAGDGLTAQRHKGHKGHKEKSFFFVAFVLFVDSALSSSSLEHPAENHGKSPFNRQASATRSIAIV